MKAFLQALYRMVSWNDEKYHRIKLVGDTPCIRFPRLKFTLFTGEGSVDLSVAEISGLLASIKTACERRDIVHVKIGDLSWTTDARLREKKPDRVAIRCWTPGGG
jgi:hypothetical protein